MKIELGGKYTTRDGRPVRILCVDGPGESPVVGIFDDAVETWGSDGIYYRCESALDLIPAKPEPVVEEQWGYEESGCVVFDCASEAQARASAAGGFRGRRLFRRTITTEIIEP